jgi:hypothetical protein
MKIMLMELLGWSEYQMTGILKGIFQDVTIKHNNTYICLLRLLRLLVSSLTAFTTPPQRESLQVFRLGPHEPLS